MVLEPRFEDDSESLFNEGALQGCQACKSDWDLGAYRPHTQLTDNFGWEWHLILRTGRCWLGTLSS